MKKNRFFYYLIFILLCTSCGIQKEILLQAENNPLTFKSLPENYYNIFPSQQITEWDKDYNLFRKFLTPTVMKTQMGLSSDADGYKTWYCFPSAIPHVQLDTATFINNKQELIGNWRIITNRKIQFKDSAVYADNYIYRTTNTLENNTKDDIIVSITDQKLQLYYNAANKTNYKTLVNKNYTIENKRYLLIHGLSKATAAVSLIGMDPFGNLIINNYCVKERQIKGIYIVYETIMNQMIFQRMQ